MHYAFRGGVDVSLCSRPSKVSHHRLQCSGSLSIPTLSFDGGVGVGWALNLSYVKRFIMGPFPVCETARDRVVVVADHVGRQSRFCGYGGTRK